MRLSLLLLLARVSVPTLIACLCPSASAESVSENTADKVRKLTITAVQLLQEDTKTGKTQPLDGRLYKRRQSSAKRQHIADVDASGTLAPAVECETNEKLEAEPKKELLINKTGPQFCNKRLKFVFEPLTFAQFKIDVSRPYQPTSAGEWGTAATRYSNMWYKLREVNPNAAVIFRDAAIAAGARALGDDKLDQFVLRDPSQDYRLVFSTEGVREIKTYQRIRGLKETGMLDSATLKALRQQD